MLLRDIFSFGTVSILNEGRGKGPMKFAGIFSEAERPNGNKRVYPSKILMREVDKLQQQIGDKRLLGELDHPADEVVHLTNVSHVITGLRMEGRKVIGEGEVLNTPAGQVLGELLKAGVKLGISSRGTGNVELNSEGSEYVVGENYNMITFDMVSDPSSQEAFPALVEGYVPSNDRQPIVDELQSLHDERVYITQLKKKLGKI